MKLRTVLGLTLASSTLLGACAAGGQGVKVKGSWHYEIVDGMEFADNRDYYQSLAPSYIAQHKAWQLHAMMDDTRFHRIRSADDYKWDWTAWSQIYDPVYAAAKVEGKVHCDAHRVNACKRVGLTTTPDPTAADRFWQAGDVPRAAVAFALACKEHPDDVYACASAGAAIRKLIDDNAAALGGKSFVVTGPLADRISELLIQYGYQRAADPATADVTIAFDEVEPTYDLDRVDEDYVHDDVTFENVTSPAQKDLAYKVEVAKNKVSFEEQWLFANPAYLLPEYGQHKALRDQYLGELRDAERSLELEAPDRKAIHNPVAIPAKTATLSGSGPCGVTVTARGGASFTPDDACKFTRSWIEHDGDEEHGVRPRRGPTDPDLLATGLFTWARTQAAFAQLHKAIPDYQPGKFTAWGYDQAPRPEDLSILLLKMLINADNPDRFARDRPFAITARYVRDECDIPTDVDPGELLSTTLPPEQR